MGSQDQGIKLFGTTITLHASSKAQAKEDRDKENPTVDKRPDKIIPCPRCKSMETKFCYFNNYNVNQPRHFYKGCQRYWTAGGALRNVPVGAGRRKTKSPVRSGPGEFPSGSLFDVSSGDGIHRFELGEMVVQEWQLMAQDDFQHIFPGKRRRNGSDGQICPC